MPASNIQEVGRRQGWNIITGRSPKGKYWFRDYEEFRAVIVDEPEPLTESFKTKQECLKWLNGER